MSTPPTIHDSDRKAGKECSVVYRSSTPVSYYAETMTLIIARHHAEERAAVEVRISSIETAPKDGRQILVRHPNGPWEIAWWETQEGEDEEEKSVYSPGWYTGHCWLSGVMEWSPLPGACPIVNPLFQHVKKLVAHFDSLFEAEGSEFPNGAFDSAKDVVEDARAALTALRTASQSPTDRFEKL